MCLQVVKCAGEECRSRTHTHTLTPTHPPTHINTLARTGNTHHLIIHKMSVGDCVCVCVRASVRVCVCVDADDGTRDMCPLCATRSHHTPCICTSPVPFPSLPLSRSRSSTVCAQQKTRFWVFLSRDRILENAVPCTGIVYAITHPHKDTIQYCIYIHPCAYLAHTHTTMTSLAHRIRKEYSMVNSSVST